MLSKVLLLVLFGLLLTKLSLRTRLREWGRKFDRFINASLIAIAVVYCAQLLYLWLAR